MNNVNLNGIQNAISKYTSQDNKMVLRKDAENFLDKIKENRSNTSNGKSQESLLMEQQETKKGSIFDTYA